MVLFYQSAEAERFNVTISSKGEMDWIETFLTRSKNAKVSEQGSSLVILLFVNFLVKACFLPVMCCISSLEASWERLQKTSQGICALRRRGLVTPSSTNEISRPLAHHYAIFLWKWTYSWYLLHKTLKGCQKSVSWAKTAIFGKKSEQTVA